MTKIEPTTCTVADFRDNTKRFIFQGGSHFANNIADLIELTAEALTQAVAEERERCAKIVRNKSFEIQSGSPHRLIFDEAVEALRKGEA
jgi:hypothetical protein